MREHAFPYKCPLCPLGFFDEADLKTHSLHHPSDPGARARLRAWAEGADAADAGIGVQLNPHPEGSQERWAWELGHESTRRASE